MTAGHLRVCVGMGMMTLAAALSGEGRTASSGYVAVPTAAERVRSVTSMKGLVAFWDFVKRDPVSGRFDAYQPAGRHADLRLDALNYVHDYWSRGPEASYQDFPLLGRGPFGQSVRIRAEADPDFRPCLLVPRSRLEGSGLDAKGPGRSVSLVAWVIREGGNHAIAGIWHEGTDLRHESGQGGGGGDPAAKVERGQRQYALFAGLAANGGGVSAHVSENGGSSFGDRYARNMATTPDRMATVPADAPAEVLDRSWSVAAFVFDDAHHTVTSYLNGVAEENWVESPQQNAFYRSAALAWEQAEARKRPDSGYEVNPAFPADQLYEPPEGEPLSTQIVETHGEERVEVQSFPFTRVRVTLRRGASGRYDTILRRELVALKVNPYWFGHDLYAPPAGEGGPFTIGRVIHSGRTVGMTGYIGGVAVFDRALSAEEMRHLAEVAKKGPVAAYEETAAH